MSNPKLLSELTQAYDYFSKRTDLYDEADIHTSRATSLENSINSQIPFVQGWKTFVLWLPIIFVLAEVLMPIINPLKRFSTFGFYLHGILSFTILFGSIWLVLFSTKKINAYIIDKKTADLNIQFETEKNSINRLWQEISTYRDQYIETVDPNFPLETEFTWPSTLLQLIEYVRLGRADTVKEALNLLAVDAQHNEALQANVDGLQQINNHLSKKLDEIEKNTRYR